MQKSELLSWQRIKTTPLLDHPYCNIVEDQLRLPSGQLAYWWRFVTTGDVACIICQDEDQSILVAYQYNNAPQQIVDEFPGGGVETGEEVKEAARRELLEETGIFAQSLQEIGSFLIDNRRSAQRMRVFVARDLEYRRAQPEPSECIAYEWVPIAEINRRIQQGVIQNGMLLAAWSIFQANLTAAT